MFFYTDTEYAPWTVVKSNDKKRARIEAHAARAAHPRLPGQGPRARSARPDPLIVGPAADVYEAGEHTGRMFPVL